MRNSKKHVIAQKENMRMVVMEVKVSYYFEKK